MSDQHLIENEDEDDDIIGPTPSTSADDEHAGTDRKRIKEFSSSEVFVRPLVPQKKRRKVLEFESTYLRNVPKAQAYEKSFMHRDVITHVAATRTDFIITASCDGNVKFWKKQHKEGIEFVKHFRTFLGSILHMTVNANGTLMCVISESKSMKIFDVPNFDMINMMKLSFVPRTCAWIHQSADPISALAISDRNSAKIFIFDGKGTEEPLCVLERLHTKSAAIMEYNAVFDITISVDDNGMLEYWHGAKKDFQFPENIVDFDSKMDTDLYFFAKTKIVPTAIAISPSGKEFVTWSPDRKLRIFKLLSGKMWKVLDESMTSYSLANQANNRYGLSNTEFSRRMAVEKELDRDHP